MELIIRGQTLKTLVDTEATKTLLGGKYTQIMTEDELSKLGPEQNLQTALGQPGKTLRKLNAKIKLAHIETELEFGLTQTLTNDAILGVDSLMKLELGIQFTKTGKKIWCPEKLELKISKIEGEVPEICGIADVIEAQQEELKKLLKEYTTPKIEHKIRLRDENPIQQKVRPVSLKVLEAIHQEVLDMLGKGVIEESKSEWSTPMVMVKKKNGKWRFCLDFKKLNKVSYKDAYPLPNMNTILDTLGSAHYLSSIDLRETYFQVPLEKQSREYTAFIVPKMGLFQLKRMPFGLSNAPATF